MSKTLIVYYSFEGNTKYACEVLAESIGAELEALSPEKEPPHGGFRKFFWGGKSAVMGEKPSLAPLSHNPSSYDSVVVAFPIWAGTYPPAIGSFLEANSLEGKKVYVMACSASGNAKKGIAKIASMVGGVEGELSLQDPLGDKEKASSLIKGFAKKYFE